jgi:hypothetical protein
MSNLTVGLAITGGLVLAAVVAHGAWTARKARPKMESPESSLDIPPAVEPQLDGFGGPLGAKAELPEISDRDLSAGALKVASPAAPVAVQRVCLDALIDAIAPIELDAPISGDAAIAAMPATRRAGTKPLMLEGQNAASQAWEQPVPRERYTALQIGVQLANRSGALNEIEFSEFVQKAQACADAVSGNIALPDMFEQVARAKELDQFAAQYDAQLGFTLRARAAAWSPGYVQQHAKRQGFVAGAVPGRMVLAATSLGLPPVLDLSFDSQAALADDPANTALREFRVNLDVAQVTRSERPFVRMRDVAIAMAASMEGLITDDAGNILSAESLDRIGADLEQLYDTLEERDLAAGSMLARRLFS